MDELTLSLTHLQRLEAEAIHIMREVVAEADNPVMLYSIGKDSSVMLRLAMKAFHPGRPPFPLLHVDTTWKFREMILFRDRTAAELGLDLLVHVNQDGLAMNISPIDHGSVVHTDIMKTQALKQALDKFGFDAAFGGARRDEEASRAKERIFSFRTEKHRWDPRHQRPRVSRKPLRVMANAAGQPAPDRPSGPTCPRPATRARCGVASVYRLGVPPQR